MTAPTRPLRPGWLARQLAAERRPRSAQATARLVRRLKALYVRWVKEET